MLRAFLMVGMGGAIGSMARYGLSLLISRTWTQPFPLATLAINLTGCLVIGLLAGWTHRNDWMNGTGWLLLATGFCGGFTTFSAFALEQVKLVEQGLSPTAALYMLLSLAGGPALCWCGILLAR